MSVGAVRIRMETLIFRRIIFRPFKVQSALADTVIG